MKLELRTDGGFGAFPGLARPLAIDTDALAPEEARRLAQLVEQCRFFERPAPAAPASERRADARRYVLCVQSGTRSRTLVLHDPVGPELAPLLELVRALGRRP